jgi:inorganic triphosphatase YgiF
METTYYDTPDGALSARNYTLRRRMENDQSVCTLKCPTEDDGRGEFELNCPDILEAIVPLEAQSSIPLTQLTSAGLMEVCGAKFQRTAITLCWQGAVLELALDKGVLTGGGKELPLWEAEVELKSGSREAARDYALRLAALYGLKQEKKSKFRRALDLAREGCGKNV